MILGEASRSSRRFLAVDAPEFLLRDNGQVEDNDEEEDAGGGGDEFAKQRDATGQLIAPELAHRALRRRDERDGEDQPGVMQEEVAGPGDDGEGEVDLGGE